MGHSTSSGRNAGNTTPSNERIQLTGEGDLQTATAERRAGLTGAEFDKALNDFRENELWGGRGNYYSETVVSNTNPNRMAPEDNVTTRRHRVELSIKASRDQNVIRELRRMGFTQRTQTTWVKDISRRRG